MCGIAGIISKDQELLSSVKKMTDVMVHRGPDGDGFYRWNNTAFGHRRLSIIDLSDNGKQPMHYQNKYTITYNGEVYNYIELRKELEHYNYQFITYTDTEVMLAAYDYWGKDCLHHFNGMFAFAILNKEKNILFCARDRFGVKPFYYYEQPGCFAFSSEIKAFTVLENWESVANKEKVFEFLKFGLHDHTAETMFQQVYQLQGGYYLSYNLVTEEKKITQWYNIRNSIQSFSNTVPETTFKELFNSSVRLRLRSDVKVGSCLSGGLDSSSVVLTVNEQLTALNQGAQQETVSSCFENKKYDEQEFIDAVVEKAGCINHKVFPNLTELYDQLSTIVWHQDEPFESTSIFAQWQVFKKAKEKNITVMLDGQGADELLAGYHAYYGVYFWELFKKMQLRKLFKEIRSLKKIGLYNHRFIATEILKNAVPLPVWLVLKKLGTKEKTWISYSYKNISVVEEDISFSSTQQMSYSQISASNLPKLVHWEDRNSMAFSIEARVPFLDYRLAGFLYHLPVEKKISCGVTKTILRNAMKDVLPMKILNRKDKMGFVTPEEEWIKMHRVELRKDIEKAIEISNGFINKNILFQFDNIVSGKVKFNPTIWRVLCFAKWIEVFKVNI
ncbi:MAG: asparagine synthase (glutamine-hydrolyzing) [Panacibacter sp.]